MVKILQMSGPGEYLGFKEVEISEERYAHLKELDLLYEPTGRNITAKGLPTLSELFQQEDN